MICRDRDAGDYTNVFMALRMWLAMYMGLRIVTAMCHQSVGTETQRRNAGLTTIGLSVRADPRLCSNKQAGLAAGRIRSDHTRVHHPDSIARMRMLLGHGDLISSARSSMAISYMGHSLVDDIRGASQCFSSDIESHFAVESSLPRRSWSCLSLASSRCISAASVSAGYIQRSTILIPSFVRSSSIVSSFNQDQ